MTDYIPSSTITDLIRTILVTIIDRPAFSLLKAIYEVFFNVASAEIFSGGVIRDFYNRVQLIIGVFMIFRLSVSILQSIVNPDKVTAKQTGMMSIIGRVFIALTLITIITPVNIKSPANEYEKQLNNNGILFGTLYSLQHRLLAQNTIGKLVLGSVGSKVSDKSYLQLSDSEELKKSAREFSTSILKAFVRINVVPENERVTTDPNKAPEEDKRNWVCSDIDQDILDKYNTDDANPGDILSFVNYSCDEAKTSGAWQKGFIYRTFKKITKLSFSESYAFSYSPLSGIVAYILSFIFLGFTLDIAIRAVKLAALRLIAPIPIISYMNPSKDNGAFGAWVKNLVSTYLDLFIRLIVVYFVVYVIKLIISDGIVINTSSGLVGSISYVLIVIGLFIFAKEAPKFIKDAIGIKGGTSNNIGLSTLLGGAAMVAGGAKLGMAAAEEAGGSKIWGAIKGGGRAFAQGAMIGERGALDAYNQGKQMPLGALWRQNNDLIEQIRTGDKDAKGGIYGRTLDKINYANRDAAATALGASKKNFALSDWWKTQATGILAQKQDTLKFAETARDQFQEQYRNDALNAKRMLEDFRSRYSADRIARSDRLRAEQNRLVEAYNATNARYNKLFEDYNAAYRDVTEWTERAQKAEKNTKKIEDTRAKIGAAPRVADLNVESYRSPLSTVDQPTIGSTGRPVDTESNYEVSAKPFVPFKGAPKVIPSLPTKGEKEGGTRTDDDAIGTIGHGSGGGPGGPPR